MNQRKIKNVWTIEQDRLLKRIIK